MQIKNINDGTTILLLYVTIPDLYNNINSMLFDANPINIHLINPLNIL
jgi:hypothetical protein